MHTSVWVKYTCFVYYVIINSNAGSVYISYMISSIPKCSGRVERGFVIHVSLRHYLRTVLYVPIATLVVQFLQYCAHRSGQKSNVQCCTYL